MELHISACMCPKFVFVFVVVVVVVFQVDWEREREREGIYSKGMQFSQTFLSLFVPRGFLWVMIDRAPDSRRGNYSIKTLERSSGLGWVLGTFFHRVRTSGWKNSRGWIFAERSTGGNQWSIYYLLAVHFCSQQGDTDSTHQKGAPEVCPPCIIDSRRGWMPHQDLTWSMGTHKTVESVDHEWIPWMVTSGTRRESDNNPASFPRFHFTC